MIKRDAYGSRFHQYIPMDVRFPEIMSVLKSSSLPVTAREIVNKYIESPNTSDVLATSSILNVLSLAGLVNKIQFNTGNVPRYKYELVTK